MKFSLSLLCFVLPACAGDIAGFTPAQRTALYATAATLTGHAEYVPIIYGARRLTTSAKNPKILTP